MVDPVNGSTEINQRDPSLLPTLQCTLQCVGHPQKCIIGTQTFPISKLGGWKHTTAFHKSLKMYIQQALKHLRQYLCYGIQSVIGNRGGRWTFRNWGVIGQSKSGNYLNVQAAETLNKEGTITSAVLLTKRGNIQNGSVPP